MAAGPKTMPKGDRLKRASRRVTALALALAMMWPHVAPLAQVRLPALGEAAAEDFSVGAERRLGEQIMREIRRDPDYLDDPQLLDYLYSLWSPLVAAARDRADINVDTDAQFAWESFLVRDRTVNAFALPGGYVGVHLGLIAMTNTRDELASVLAHELSHVTQRHIARSMASSQRQGLIGMAALILGILAASRSSNADVAQAAVMGSQAAMMQGQLNFSRDMEREADRIGFGLLLHAGYAGSGMTHMFEKLDIANRLNDNGAFPYLRSHPLTTERISEARGRVLQSGSVLETSTLWHQLMRARARVLMDPSAVALRKQQDVLGTLPAANRFDRIAALYAGAMASSMLRDHAKAEAAVEEALRWVQSPDLNEPRARQELWLMQAQVAMEQGQHERAYALLSRPEVQASRGVLLLRSQAALGMARQQLPTAAVALREHTEALQAWVAEHPHDAAAWSTLAQCADSLGLKLRSLRAQAEVRAALGDLSGAVDRLRVGQNLVRTGAATDHIEASVLDARVRQLQAQRRELAAEMRGSRGGTSPDGERAPE